MADTKVSGQSHYAVPAECSQPFAKHCRSSDQSKQGIRPRDTCREACLLESPYEVNRNSVHSVSSRSRRVIFQTPFAVFLAFLAFYFTSPSVASGAVSLSPEITRDMTDVSISIANAVRREGIDSSLRKYAFLALSQAKTGTTYNVSLTPHLSGIRAQAILLQPGSLKTRGLIFNEFTIPEAAVLNTTGSLVIMIYRKIFNFTVYSLPVGYDFVGPVVGIVIYAPSNITTDDPTLPEISLTSQNGSIRVHVPITQPLGKTVPLCAFFSANGSVAIRNVTTAPNVCTSASLGDVALVLPSFMSPPPPSFATAPTAPTAPTTSTRDQLPSRKTSGHWKLAVGVTFLCLTGVAFLIAVALVSVGLVERVKVAIMEHFADNEEALQTSLIGNSRAPTAAGVRTRPTLEMDMARFRD